MSVPLRRTPSNKPRRKPLSTERWLDDVLASETTLPPMIQPDTEKALRTAGRKVAEWTAERDRLVKQAVKEGGSLREVGEAVGMSHTAVKFIAHGRPT